LLRKALDNSVVSGGIAPGMQLVVAMVRLEALSAVWVLGSVPAMRSFDRRRAWRPRYYVTGRLDVTASGLRTAVVRDRANADQEVDHSEAEVERGELYWPTRSFPGSPPTCIAPLGRRCPAPRPRRPGITTH
jgi:hypothetical protein